MDNPVHVLHIVCFSYPYGVQRSILSTARSLDPSRYRASVAAPPEPRFEAILAEAGVPFHAMPMSGLFDLRAARRLARLMRDERVGIVHVHLGISSFLGLLAARRAGNIPVVVTRHFLEDRYTTIAKPLVRSVYRRVYRWMNRRFARIVFVSEAVREAVSAREGMAPEKCRVVPNGLLLPAELRPPTAAERAASRATLGLPETARVIINLSRLSPEKDVATLVRAMPAVLDIEPDVRLVVLGDGDLEEELREMAERLGVGGRVIFMGFRLDAVELLRGGDVFVMGSYAEPFGISLLEAMSMGLPVVGADSAGPAELLRGGQDGMLFEPRDPGSLAGCLIRLLTDPALREDYAARSLRRAAEFDERLVIERMQEIYREVLS